MLETGPSLIRRVLPLGLFGASVVAVMILVPMVIRPLELHPLMGTIVGQFALLTLTLLFASLDGQGFASMGLSKRWEDMDYLLMLVVVAVHFGGSMLVSLWMMNSKGQAGNMDSRAVEMFSLLGDVPPLQFLGVVLFLSALAGVGEELLFRGYLFTRLERVGLPGWAVIIMTGLLFGLLHTRGYGLAASLSKGLMFGIPTATYFWFRRRLAPLMLVHFFVDFSALSLMYVVVRYLPKYLL